MDNEKGYIFKSYFESILYLIIIIAYPIVSYCIQLNTMCNMNDIYVSAVSGSFIAAGLYYDFYLRYRDCKQQTKSVVVILYWGRIIFFIYWLVTIGALLLCLFVSKMWAIIYYFCPLLALYPVLMTLFDIKKRLISEKNNKIDSN